MDRTLPTLLSTSSFVHLWPLVSFHFILHGKKNIPGFSLKYMFVSMENTLAWMSSSLWSDASLSSSADPAPLHKLTSARSSSITLALMFFRPLLLRYRQGTILGQIAQQGRTHVAKGPRKDKPSKDTPEGIQQRRPSGSVNVEAGESAGPPQELDPQQTSTTHGSTSMSNAAAQFWSRRWSILSSSSWCPWEYLS